MDSAWGTDGDLHLTVRRRENDETFMQHYRRSLQCQRFVAVRSKAFIYFLPCLLSEREKSVASGGMTYMDVPQH